MSLDIEQARHIVNEYLIKISIEIGEKCIISHIQNVDIKGWLFFYNTELFIHTNNYLYALAGNSPLFISVDRDLFILNTLNDPLLQINDLLGRS